MIQKDSRHPVRRTLSRAQAAQIDQNALDTAARMLSYRAMTEAALRDKLLNKGFAAQAVEDAVEYLRIHGFLDDQKYADSTVRSYTRRGYGTMRIRQELRRRGVCQEEAEIAMQSHEPEWARMRALLDKRLHGDLSDRKEVNKAIAALQRRGFRWEEIRKALNDYGASIDADFD